jgi:hypothetical protein
MRTIYHLTKASSVENYTREWRFCSVIQRNFCIPEELSSYRAECMYNIYTDTGQSP